MKRKALCLLVEKGGIFIISEVYWDQGRKELNEDSISLQEVTVRGEKITFAVICDGIGGLWGGEVASGFITEQMTEWFYREAIRLFTKRKSGKKIIRSAVRVLYACNEEFGKYGQAKNVSFGTACTILLIRKRTYLVWHIGDTRAYMIPDFGKIRQLTRDHSASKNILTGCIGSFAWKPPDIIKGRIHTKTTFLVCSDGFRHIVTMDRMGETFHPREICSREQIYIRLREIADYSLKHGEQDNISAAVIVTGS